MGETKEAGRLKPPASLCRPQICNYTVLFQTMTQCSIELVTMAMIVSALKCTDVYNWIRKISPLTPKSCLRLCFTHKVSHSFVINNWHQLSQWLKIIRSSLTKTFISKHTLGNTFVLLPICYSGLALCNCYILIYNRVNANFDTLQGRRQVSRSEGA